MSETSGFFVSQGGDRRYTPAWLAGYIKSLVTTGVYKDELAVAAGDGMAVSLPYGRAWVEGYLYLNDAPLAMAIGNADSALGRKDSVVIRLNLTDRTITAMVLPGVFSASPTAPEPVRNADIYDLKLAEINVPAGTTKITQELILDTRLDDAVCGITVCTVQHIPTATFLAQMQAGFAAFMQERTEAFTSFMQGNGTEFKTFMQNSGAEFESFMQSSGTEYGSFMQRSDAGFDAFMENSAGELSAFLQKSKETFDTWFAALLELFDGETAGRLLDALNGHIADKDNPHGVTAEQIGAATTGAMETTTSTATAAKQTADDAKKAAEAAQTAASTAQATATAAKAVADAALPASGGTLTGNLTLKGTGNFGTKINLGDGDCVHISEPKDDCLEIKAKQINFLASNFPANSNALTIQQNADATAYKIITEKDLNEAIYSTKLALGSSATANGNYSIAIGSNVNNIAGDCSIAVGRNTSTNGHNSIALGRNTSASGESSTALGNIAKASSDFSTALGYGANASGRSSIALGDTAIASGDYSTALGIHAVASGDYSSALGMYSTAANANSIQLGSPDLSGLYCFVALTRQSDERDKTDITPIDDGAVEFIRKIKAIRYLRNNRVGYHYDEETLDEDGKEKRAKYGLYGYDKEAHARGDKKGSRVRVGVIAQQVQRALQEVYGDASYGNLVNDNFFDYDPATIPEDVENQLGVSYENFIPFLIKAVQELAERLEALEVAR